MENIDGDNVLVLATALIMQHKHAISANILANAIVGATQYKDSILINLFTLYAQERNDTVKEEIINQLVTYVKENMKECNKGE